MSGDTPMPMAALPVFTAAAEAGSVEAATTTTAAAAVVEVAPATTVTTATSTLIVAASVVVAPTEDNLDSLGYAYAFAAHTQPTDVDLDALQSHPVDQQAPTTARAGDDFEV
jgi:hypothetical protein